MSCEVTAGQVAMGLVVSVGPTAAVIATAERSDRLRLVMALVAGVPVGVLGIWMVIEAGHLAGLVVLGGMALGGLLGRGAVWSIPEHGAWRGVVLGTLGTLAPLVAGLIFTVVAFTMVGVCLS
jgi:hypothetical protein